MGKKLEYVMLRMKTCPSMFVTLSYLGVLVKDASKEFITLASPVRLAETASVVQVPVEGGAYRQETQLKTIFLWDDLLSTDKLSKFLLHDVQVISPADPKGDAALLENYEKWCEERRLAASGLVAPTALDVQKASKSRQENGARV